MSDVGMLEVVGWLRSRGRLVLVAEAGAYTLDNRVLTARQLLTEANRERMRLDLELFPLDVANPTHRGWRRQRGSFQMFFGGPRCSSL